MLVAISRCDQRGGKKKKKKIFQVVLFAVSQVSFGNKKNPTFLLCGKQNTRTSRLHVRTSHGGVMFQPLGFSLGVFRERQVRGRGTLVRQVGGGAAGEERRVTFVLPISVVGIVIPSP